MKKFITLSIAAAICASLSAESVKILTVEEGGIPGQTEPELIAIGLSPNGNYVCGTLTEGVGIFIADTQTGDVKYKVFENEGGGELRNVDNNGLGIGFEDFGIVYSFESGVATELVGPEDVKYILGEALTNNGDILFGSFSTAGFATTGAYSKDGGEWIALPMPTEEQLGNYVGKVRMETAVKKVSGDGKVVLGNVGGFGAPILWIQNENGEYEVDFFPARLVKLTDADRTDDTKPFYSISGMYGASVSNNGRYVTMLALINEPGAEGSVGVPAVYDTKTKQVKIYDELQEIDSYGLGLYPIAIADNGTFVGTVGQPFYGSSGTFIMMPGLTQAQGLGEVFPEYYDLLGETDMYGFSVPVGISADGSTIAGYAFYSDDFNDVSTPAYYTTYLISGIEYAAVEALPASDTNNQYIYSIDGRRLNSLTKGINIVRNPDGTTTKILK